MVDRFPVVLRGYDKERVDEAMLAAQNSIASSTRSLS